MLFLQKTDWPPSTMKGARGRSRSIEVAEGIGRGNSGSLRGRGWGSGGVPPDVHAWVQVVWVDLEGEIQGIGRRGASWGDVPLGC
jgi:hypothetical protein